MLKSSAVCFLILAGCLAGFVAKASAQDVRLLAITGHFGLEDGFDVPDGTVFEIDLTDGLATELVAMTDVPQAHVIGYNPVDGLLYHTAGGESWTSIPAEEAECCSAFRDHQYMESYNLDTGQFTAIFNANPPDSPDEYPGFGLPAPRPTWVFPTEIRLIDQTDISYQARGEGEYSALRSLTWSDADGLFYAGDHSTGIWKMTTDGQPTQLSSTPVKALTFFEQADGTVVLLGANKDDELLTIDPANGQVIGDGITLEVPEGSEFDTEFGAIYGLAQHPETKVLYGLRSTPGGTKVDRELVTIDPLTGQTQLITNTERHFTSLTFVHPPKVDGLSGDFNHNGILDIADIDDLTGQSAGGLNPTDPYDVTDDDLVNDADVVFWIHELFGSWIGDANLDGLFDTNDLIAVLAARTYEQTVPAKWSTGDFNGSGRFDSNDLIDALADEGYENGSYPGVAAVPEPASGLLLSMFALLLLRYRRRM